MTIKKIYREILAGKRTRFPPGTWNQKESYALVKIVTRYLIEEYLQWSDEDIKENWNLKLIQKYKLSGVCSILFKESPYAMLEAVYPNRFQKWDLKNLPKNSWTREKALEDLRYWIEKKERLTKEQLKDTYSGSWLRKRGLDSPLQMYWNSSPYQMLDAAYPNQFYEWEFKKVSQNYWNDKEKSLNIFREIIKIQNLSIDDIKNRYCLRWIVHHGLRTPLIKFWNDSPYKMLNEAFPNQIHEWELKEAPRGTWTDKECAISIIKNEINNSGLSISQLLEQGIRKWMKDKKLITPFNRYWYANPLRMLQEIYPEEYKKQIDIE